MRVKYCPGCGGYMKHYSDSHGENYGYHESWFRCEYCNIGIAGDNYDDDEEFYWEE